VTQLCDTSATNVCVVCLDAGGPDPDPGCADPTAPQCVPGGLGMTCTECDDDASGADTDSGCSAGAPICYEGCVVWVDDAADDASDTGCSAPTPLCDDSDDEPVCVAGTVDAGTPIASRCVIGLRVEHATPGATLPPCLLRAQTGPKPLCVGAHGFGPRGGQERLDRCRYLTRPPLAHRQRLRGTDECNSTLHGEVRRSEVGR
jgi:hypothetical protein